MTRNSGKNKTGSPREPSRATARRVSNSRPARVLARAGLVSSGMVHALIGIIAISVANGLRGRADQSGALKAVADFPGGPLLLWCAAAGLFGLALWTWTGPVSSRKEGVLPLRLRDRVKAVGFFAVGLAAMAFAVGGRTDSAEKTKTFSSILINVPGGVWALAAIGVIVASVGGAFIFRGISRNFREDIAPPAGFATVATVTLGVFGHVAKGLALFVVGALFVGGAVFTDTTWAYGLDGAVRYLAGLPTGVWPLLVIAIGLIAHGLYLCARAAFMRR